MKLSPHEVADLVVKAGFSKNTIVPGTTDSEAVVAVAIVFAESGADTENISRTTAALTSDPGSVGNRDHGLFQLSGRWQYPKIQAAGGRWRDPEVNVKLAYEIFKGANRTFTPWMVFAKDAKTGIAPFEQYLPDARLGVQQPWPYVSDEIAALTKLSADLAKSQATVVELAAAVKSMAVQITELRAHFK